MLYSRRVGHYTFALRPANRGTGLSSLLSVKRDFTNWIRERIQKYGFEEDRDFTRSPDLASNNPHPRVDYHVSLDMAKELSMVERTKKGKQAYYVEAIHSTLPGWLMRQYGQVALVPRNAEADTTDPGVPYHRTRGAR